MGAFIFGLVCLLLIFWVVKERRKSKIPRPSAPRKRVVLKQDVSREWSGARRIESDFVFEEKATSIPLKSRGGYVGPYVEPARKRSEFSYPDNPNPSEFIVYFIESEILNALKIGVGTAGRVLQLLSSTVKVDDQIESIGWKVLRTARFSSSSLDYESGRLNAYEAEARVLFYWQKHLGLKPHVLERDMGYSQLVCNGALSFYLTKGYTETVEKSAVCEESTWAIITNSEGYLGEGSTFFDGRSLVKNPEKRIAPSLTSEYHQARENLARERERRYARDNSDTTRYLNRDLIPANATFRSRMRIPDSDGTKEGKFWARVDKTQNTCWLWTGSIMTDGGYGVMLWEGSPRPAHRIAWQIVKREMPTGDFLINSCSNRLCVNPEHWELNRVLERRCTTEGCDGISIKKMVDGRCAKCERNARYERRKNRVNPYKCLDAECQNPSGTVAFQSLCMPCRRKAKKEN